MEPSRFDDLTKALATSTSRRQALKTITATTLGSILSLAGIGTVFAKSTCKANGHGCGNNKQCCSGFCDQTTSTCACKPGTCNSVCTCPSGQLCSGGQCVCPPGAIQLCNGTCATNCFSTGCSNSCQCVQDAAAGNYYCAQGAASQGCSSDCDCRIGEFCVSGSPTGFCTGAC